MTLVFPELVTPCSLSLIISAIARGLLTEHVQ